MSELTAKMGIDLGLFGHVWVCMRVLRVLNELNMYMIEHDHADDGISDSDREDGTLVRRFQAILAC